MAFKLWTWRRLGGDVTTGLTRLDSGRLPVSRSRAECVTM